MANTQDLKTAYEATLNDAQQVHLSTHKLGDPEYERGDGINNSRLTFFGTAADYVAEMLGEARSERERRKLVREYTTIYATSAMPAIQLEKILSEFALRLLDSSAVR